MSTSAERVLRDGSTVRLRDVPYDDPVAQALVQEVQAEYVQRYGGPDGGVVDPAGFLPPEGVFLVAGGDGVPAGCGAWRGHRAGGGGVKKGYLGPGPPPPGAPPAPLSAPQSRAA